MVAESKDVEVAVDTESADGVRGPGQEFCPVCRDLRARVDELLDVLDARDSALRATAQAKLRTPPPRKPRKRKRVRR